MLFPLSPEERIKHLLETITGTKVELKITNNISSLVTAKKMNGVYTVRLSNIFLNADDNVIKDLALFITKKAKISESLRQFIRKHQDKTSIRKNKISIVHEGKYFNLYDIYRRLNKNYFDNKLDLNITWGKRSSKTYVKKRQLGSYNKKDKLIRINPVLDNKKVPDFYIEFIVYHEMLHAVLDTKMANKRRIVHSREFKEKERHFYRYEDAIKWEKGNRF